MFLLCVFVRVAVVCTKGEYYMTTQLQQEIEKSLTLLKSDPYFKSALEAIDGREKDFNLRFNGWEEINPGISREYREEASKLHAQQRLEVIDLYTRQQGEDVKSCFGYNREASDLLFKQLMVASDFHWKQQMERLDHSARIREYYRDSRPSEFYHRRTNGRRFVINENRRSDGSIFPSLGQ